MEFAEFASNLPCQIITTMDLSWFLFPGLPSVFFFRRCQGTSGHFSARVYCIAVLGDILLRCTWVITLMPITLLGEDRLVVLGGADTFFWQKRLKGFNIVTQDVTLIYLAKVGLKIRKKTQNMEINMEKLTSEFFCVFKVVFLVHGVLQRCNDCTCHLAKIKMGEVSEP